MHLWGIFPRGYFVRYFARDGEHRVLASDSKAYAIDRLLVSRVMLYDWHFNGRGKTMSVMA